MAIERICAGCGRGFTTALKGRFVLTEYDGTLPLYKQAFCSFPCILRQKPAVVNQEAKE